MVAARHEIFLANPSLVESRHSSTPASSPELPVTESEKPQPPASLSYRDAGVDIDAGNSLVERIKPLVKATFRPGVLGGLGGFGALFELPLDRYREPVLVSGTDGVGTKLKLASMTGVHNPSRPPSARVEGCRTLVGQTLIH